MTKKEQSIAMIGYRPSMLESMKISLIGEVFDLNSCAVLREIMTGHWTLDELHAIARKSNPVHMGAILPYLKEAYDMKKNADEIVKDGNRAYAKDILGIDEPEEFTEWEFITKENNEKI